jgi:hypothetical protein
MHHPHILRLKQQYIDPGNKRHTVREIGLILEELRLKDSLDSGTKFTITAWLENSELNAICFHTDEAIVALLDSKRTSPPYGCNQTYLVEPYENGDTLHVHDSLNLDVRVGDPIVIMSDMNGTNRQNAIVENVNGHTLTVSRGKLGDFSFRYKVGAIVQNLSNQWKKYPLEDGQLGIKSFLKKPQEIPFEARFNGDKIQIIMEKPMNFGIGTIVACDVYVRERVFQYVEPHWIPDMEDVSPQIESINVSTHGGGEKSGGGLLERGKTYYVSVVTKDRLGRVNVNESESIAKPIKT